MEEVDLTLIATQRKAVMALVQTEGFDPAEFEWQTAIQDEHDRDYAVTFRNTVSVLLHKETEYFFRFEKYRSKYSPGHQLRTRIESWNRLIDRDGHLRDWLFNLRTEVAEQNPVNTSSGGDLEKIVETVPALRGKEDSSPQPVGLIPEWRNPRAFVSYGSEDRVFVDKLAVDLRWYGVDAWYDKWEIKTGDPIPAKIDEGLEGCEFFIIVLSRTSVNRPWVKMELGAAIARIANGKIRRIIPVRLDDCSDLPSTISSLRSEDFSNEPYDSALKRVLDSIFDVDVRPPLGKRPDDPANPSESNPSSIASSRRKGDTAI